MYGAGGTGQPNRVHSGGLRCQENLTGAGVRPAPVGLLWVLLRHHYGLGGVGVVAVAQLTLYITAPAIGLAVAAKGTGVNVPNAYLAKGYSRRHLTC